MLPIKVWNSSRNEKKLEQQQLRLNEARLAALSRQINPHFLFNTLNTVSALIRFDPDTARGVVLKLSNILRRLLRKHETFVPLREELEFIDNYLDIEVARFGRDQKLVPESVVRAVDGVVQLRNLVASDPARATREHAVQYLALPVGVLDPRGALLLGQRQLRDQAAALRDQADNAGVHLVQAAPQPGDARLLLCRVGCFLVRL